MKLPAVSGKGVETDALLGGTKHVGADLGFYLWSSVAHTVIRRDDHDL